METSKIYCGDNLDVMKALPSESIDLIYIDPPFCTGTVQASKSSGKEIGYNDKWEGGLQSYIRWFVPRLQECHRLLKDSGSIFMHCDWRASHRLRVMLDDVFGEKNFVNEIIWSYKTYQGKVKSYFPKKHDTILWYEKKSRDKSVFNLLYDDNYKNTGNYNRWKKYFEMEKDTPVIRYGNHPESDSRFKAYLKRWKKENKRNPENKEIIYKQTGGVISDVWPDIQAIDPKDKSEKIGYPTQKPLKLLERIIRCASNEGDTVADFFCGSGTTLVAAERLNRRWLGVDISEDAVSIAKKRLD